MARTRTGDALDDLAFAGRALRIDVTARHALGGSAARTARLTNVARAAVVIGRARVPRRALTRTRRGHAYDQLAAITGSALRVLVTAGDADVGPTAETRLADRASRAISV